MTRAGARRRMSGCRGPGDGERRDGGGSLILRPADAEGRDREIGANRYVRGDDGGPPAHLSRRQPPKDPPGIQTGLPGPRQVPRLGKAAPYGAKLIN